MISETRTALLNSFNGIAHSWRLLFHASKLVLSLALFAKSISAAELTLTWNDNSDSEDGFKIERSLDGASFNEIATVGANVSLYQDKTVVEGQAYTYRVRAFNEHGNSGYSNTASGEVDIVVGAPSISPFTNVSILEGGNSGPIEFTIDDEDTILSELSVSASSSNPALISLEGIVLVGDGALRTIELTPTLGSSGTSTITVSVSDGNRTTNATFEVEVRSIAAPTISPISDVVVLLGESISPIELNLHDDETPTEDLAISIGSSNLQLLPTENISLEGSGSNRTLTLLPAADQLGLATLTITVADGEFEAVESFEVVVQSPPVIITQPVDTDVIVGDITAFDVEVIAYPLPDIFWLRNGQLIEGMDDSELLFPRASLADAGSYSVLISNELGSVSSDVVQLNVESLIKIVEAPEEVVIQGEGSATLSVNATGPGLIFQWYRGQSGDRSNPIEGATESTYVTDTLTENSQYWVEIKTGGIAQGLETAEGPTIEVDIVYPNRYYFGYLGEENQGTFSLMIRGDDTAVFLANAAHFNNPVEIIDLQVSESGYFQYVDNEGIVAISGDADGAGVSGVLFNGSMTSSFSGSKADDESFRAADFDGLYRAVMPSTSDGQAIVIAAPDGQAFVSVGLNSTFSSGFAQVDESGVVTADLYNDFALAVQLDASVKSLNGSIFLGDNNFALDGQHEDVITRNLLFNTSVRGQVSRGSSTMIAGFVVGGTGTKKVLIRGLGPALVSRGVRDGIADPRLDLYRLGDNDPIAVNDDWQVASNAAEVSEAQRLVGASPLSEGSNDAALLIELPGGVYTAVVSNVSGSEGTALVEVFDVSESAGETSESRLANISMRGEVGRGGDVTIAGFVITGQSPKRVLVRAMGTELSNFGVSGVLEDPKLSIYQSTNEGQVLLAENDDWHEEATLVTELAEAVGAFAFDNDSKSSAQVIWLDPGLYTAVVESADSSRGVALVEVYELD